jgi:hypothetical protein
LIYSAPSLENLSRYFDYLNTRTILTRDYVRENWSKIVLVDSSSGASISGVLIFLNRYIGNIKPEPNAIACSNIKGSQPLQFIRLVGMYTRSVNLEPEIALKMFSKQYNRYVVNFRPDLIVHIGDAIFLSRDAFMIYDEYPYWDIPPDEVCNPSFTRGLQNIKDLHSIQNIYADASQGSTMDNNSLKFLSRDRTQISL